MKNDKSKPIVNNPKNKPLLPNLKIVNLPLSSIIFAILSLASSSLLANSNNCIGDCLNGKGTLTYPDNTRYEGSFKNGKREGQGTIVMLNGNKYVGGWKNDVKEGQGVLTLENGIKFEGEFKHGKYDGQGRLTLPNGEKFVGKFKNGKFEEPIKAITQESYPQPTENKLTEQSIKNSEFILFSENDSNSCKVKLENGEATVCDEHYSVDNIVFGDLNGDSIEDAAVNISIIPVDGNGITPMVVVFTNSQGKPKYVGNTYFAKSNQPASLEAMEIKDRKIFLNILGKKDEDPNCCPSLKIKEVYQLNEKGLVLLSEQKPITEPQNSRVSALKNNGLSETAKVSNAPNKSIIQTPDSEEKNETATKRFLKKLWHDFMAK